MVLRRYFQSTCGFEAIFASNLWFWGVILKRTVVLRQYLQITCGPESVFGNKPLFSEFRNIHKYIEEFIQLRSLRNGRNRIFFLNFAKR